ncbi:MAG: hypothetical protein ACTHJ9_17245 [Rhodanobacter sp.]
MREYGKIHSSFWTSEDIRQLGEDGRTLAAYLLTSPHSNMLGCFRCPIAYISDDLRWPIERVREGFAKLSQRVWATFEEGSGWVVIHKFLKWNQPENPNVVRAAEKLFAQIPGNCGVKSILAWSIAEFEPRFSVDKLVVSKPFANPFDMSRKAYRKPEPEPEPEPLPEPEVEPEPNHVAPTRGEGEIPTAAGSPTVSRAIEIAVYLRQRGVVGANSVNPNISAWGDDVRVTNEILDAAISKANASLKGKSITVAYLATIIPDLLNPQPAKRRESQLSLQAMTDAQRDAIARDMGISGARAGESRDAFIARIQAKRMEAQGATA